MRFLATLSSLLLLCSVAVAGVVCDGTDDVVTAANENSFDLTNATFTVCVRFATTHSGSARQFIAKGAAAESAWFIGTTSAGLMSVNIRNAAAEAIAGRNSVGAYNDGAFHRTCVVFTTNTTTRDSNLITIYVDGVLDQGSISHTGTGAYAQNGTALKLCQGPSGFMGVTIEDVAIYSGDIGAAYASIVGLGGIKRPQLTQALISYWPMTECPQAASCDAVVLKDRGATGDFTADNGAGNANLLGSSASPMIGVAR